MTRLCEHCGKQFEGGAPAFEFLLRFCDPCAKLKAEYVATKLRLQELQQEGETE